MTPMADRGESHPGAAPGADTTALLARAARGDEDAWRALINLYARRVYALARSRCRRDDLAEEITQSVFATVAEKLRSPDLPGGYTDQGRFEPWLFRVAMNRVRDEIRRLQRHAEPTDPGNFEALRLAPEEPDRADPRDLQRLREALAELNDADRQIIELRHHAQLSFKTIAAMLEEPVGTLLARHHRALRKLKSILESAGMKPALESE